MKNRFLLVILALIFIAAAPVYAARKQAEPISELEEVILEAPEDIETEEDEIEVPQAISITEQKAPVEEKSFSGIKVMV